MDVLCSYCRKGSHLIRDCPEKQRDKDSLNNKFASALMPPPSSVETGVAPPGDMSFMHFCRAMQKLQETRKHSEKEAILQTLWKKVRSCPTGDLYGLLRLLLPKWDTERRSYGMKEMNLARMYCEIYNFSADTTAAKRLLGWRKPEAGKGMGIFSDVVFDVMESRTTKEPKLLLSQVNHFLDMLSKEEDKERKVQIMRQLSTSTTAFEQRWIVRIIIKDLFANISETSVMKSFHPDALELFNVCCSLKQVATELRDLHVRLSTKNVCLFRAVRPMLAERLDPTELKLKIKSKPYVMELKYDGERMQLHKDGSLVRFFARKGKEWTDVYGHQLLPPILRCVKAETCIIDGELLVWNTERQIFEEFGSAKTVAKEGRDRAKVSPELLFELTNGTAKNRNLCFVAFDLLFVNGEVITDQPLRSRRQKLEQIIDPLDRQFEIATQVEGKSDISCVLSYMEEVMSEKGEGIMIKFLDSAFHPGERGAHWFKLKPDYFQGVGEDFDLVIIGAFFGRGKRGGRLWEFLLAAADPPPPGYSEPITFSSFCKVGTGLNEVQFRELEEALSPFWEDFDPKNVPSWLNTTLEAKARPHRIIEPRFSKVMQIKGDVRLIESKVFAVPYSIRFPRIVRVRDDKPWQDIATTADIMRRVRSLEAYDLQKHMDMDNGIIRRKRGRFTVKPTVLSHFQLADVSEVERESDAFDKLCVMLVLDKQNEYRKEELAGKIKRLGGKHTMLMTNEVTHIVASSNKGIMFAQLSGYDKDILSTEWLDECTKANAIVGIEPRFMIQTSLETQHKFVSMFDVYGDSYYEPITETILSQLLSRMIVDMKEGGTEAPIDSSDEDDDDEEDHCEHDHDLASSYDAISILSSSTMSRRRKKTMELEAMKPLKHVVAYFQKPIFVPDDDRLSREDLYAIRVAMYGGVVSAELDESVTHVIVEEEFWNPSTVWWYQTELRKKGFEPIITTAKWIEDSAQGLQDPSSYEVKFQDNVS